MQRPVLNAIVDAAGDPVRYLVERRKQIVGVRARKCAPGAGRSKVIERARGKRRAIARVAVVLETELQVVGGMHQQVHGAKFAHSGPVVIGGQPAQPAGQRRGVVAVPIVIALAKVRTQVVEPALAHRQLRAGKRFASDTARGERVIVGETVRVLLGFAEQAEIEQAWTLAQVEQLLEFGLISADVGEAVAEGRGAGVFKASPRQRFRAILRQLSCPRRLPVSNANAIVILVFIAGPQCRKLTSKFDP